jgi:alkylation response protein AidB-like acyl-CoA dehydrogenase
MMHAKTDIKDVLLDRIRSLEPLIRGCELEMERDRRLPETLRKAFLAADLFKLWVPRSLGGLEIDLVTYYEIIEAVSAISGSAGWNLMLNSSLAFFSCGIPEWSAQELFNHPDAILAGQINITSGGRAVAVPGGYRVTGRWAFASGIHQATCVLSAVAIYDGDEPRKDHKGEPMHRYVLTHKSEVEVEDTWHTLGLRGTGSNHYRCANVFVPEERLFLRTDAGFHPGPLYKCKEAFHYAIAIPLLGIARGAIDAFKDVATKSATRKGTFLKDSELVQVDLARVESNLGAARANLWALSDEIYGAASRGDAISDKLINRAELATVHVGQVAADVVDTVFDACGGTAVYQSHPLERRFRDIHTARQHAGVSRARLVAAGLGIFAGF